MGFYDDALEVVRLAVEKAGSIRALAKQAGIGHVAISQWLSGEKRPSLALLAAVFDVVGATVCMRGEQAPDNKDTRAEALEKEVIALRAQVDVLERVVGLSKSSGSKPSEKNAV